jgi:hypothetical protein
MITLRYHIASLCAIILTLGIGIWVGLAIGSPDLMRQQTALIKQSNKKLDQVLQERQEDAQMLEQNRQALAGLVPHFTHAMLYNKRVAIIRTGDYPDAAQSAIDSLAETGATIACSITISDQLDDISAKQRSDIMGPLMTVPPWSLMPDDNSLLIHTLTQALKSGTTNHPNVQNSVDGMTSSGLISYSGDFSAPVDLIIVVGGVATDPGEVDTTSQQAREKMVIDQLTATNEFSDTQVVGCEPREVDTSSIPIYEEEGIGSVDCIDEPLGVLDIVYALHGETAAYGIKPGSRLLAPASLESENDGN